MEKTTMPDPFDLGGKVAIVTGAGTGIGRAIARLFAENGADIVLAGRKLEPLEETAVMVEALGRRASVIPTDVKDTEACQRLIDETLARHGRIDMLINNAGGSRAGTLDTWRLKDFEDMVRLNLTSVWVLSLAAARHMREHGGAIVNISSMASVRAITHSAPYGAAKAGLNNLTATLAVDLAPFGIRVNAIAPGVIRTEGFERSSGRRNVDVPALARKNSVLGRLGEPEEIAWPALFLVSPGAGYITGQTLFVCGSPVA
jgi:NAD(P)-dependent dehydrogenase (short-subunit alcohol dehydrogenase family)